MIEFCTRKRMVISILIMICLSCVTLFIENKWSSRLRNMKIIKKIGSINVTCKSNKMELLEDCQQCPEAERYKSYCKSTGFRRVSLCDTEKVYTSCTKESTSSRNFWIFEGCMAVTAIVSYIIVHYQQNSLNRKLLEKINKQIAAGI